MPKKYIEFKTFNLADEFDETNTFPNMKLTIKKTAPNITAFILTSRSIGNVIPKLSASVKASLAKPVHCLEIFPTWVLLSADKTLKKQQMT